jgi:hypothetical protein
LRQRVAPVVGAAAVGDTEAVGSAGEAEAGDVSAGLSAAAEQHGEQENGGRRHDLFFHSVTPLSVINIVRMSPCTVIIICPDKTVNPATKSFNYHNVIYLTL